MQTILKIFLVLFCLQQAKATDVKLEDIWNPEGEDFHLAFKLPYFTKRKPIETRAELIINELKKLPGKEGEIKLVESIKRILSSATLKQYIYDPLMKSVEIHDVELPKGFAKELAPIIIYYEDVHVPKVAIEEIRLLSKKRYFDRDYNPTVHYEVFKSFLIDYHKELFSPPTFPADFLETLWKDMLQPVEKDKTFWESIVEHNKFIKNGIRTFKIGVCAVALLGAYHLGKGSPVDRLGDVSSTAPSEVQNVVSPEKGAEELGDKLFRKLNQGK